MKEQAKGRGRGANKQLSLQEEAFCHFYLQHGNQARAAAEAGYKPERQGIARFAWRISVRPHVAAYIKKERLKRAETLGIDTDWVISRLIQQAEDEEVKPSDRIRALELIGKNLGLFTDRHEVNVTGDVNLLTQRAEALVAKAMLIEQQKAPALPPIEDAEIVDE